MPLITVTPADFGNDFDPSSPLLMRIEDAGYCDGADCGNKWAIGDEVFELGPHHHVWIAAGRPDATPLIAFPVLSH
jgi:hypothetical protein